VNKFMAKVVQYALEICESIKIDRRSQSIQLFENGEIFADITWDDGEPFIDYNNKYASLLVELIEKFELLKGEDCW